MLPIALLALGVLPGCSDDDAAPDVTNVDALDVGGQGPRETCLRVTADLGVMVTDLPAVSCSLEHTHEIYYVSQAVDDAVYPGLEALEDRASNGLPRAVHHVRGSRRVRLTVLLHVDRAEHRHVERQ